MKQNEAVIILCKCGRRHKTFGIRTELIGRDCWEMNWAFPIKDATAGREGYDKTDIRGNIKIAESFPGCPYCEGKEYVLCSTCGHLSCQIMNGDIFTCEWCGNTGLIEGYSGETQIIAGTDA